jgi:hypothetical protein
VALRPQELLCQEAAGLIRTQRLSNSRVFEDGQQLLEWAYEEGRHTLRCLLLLGTGISWSVQEKLQRLGFHVGRLPFDEPAEIRRYAERLAARERQGTRLPRRVWVVAPRSDVFTRTLHHFLQLPIQEALRDEGFPAEAIIWADGTRRPDGALPGLILLLTHGAADASSGVPQGSAELLHAIYEACEQGAVVAHLGCNGAGGSRNGRYEELASWNLMESLPPALPRDVFSVFSRTCLQRGAHTVFAHVDVTWSHTLYPSRPFEEWLRGVCSGSVAASFAALDFHAEADRAAFQALDQRREQRLQEAGGSWLRHLDLHGFVTLGDPASTFRWE